MTTTTRKYPALLFATAILYGCGDGTPLVAPTNDATSQLSMQRAASLAANGVGVGARTFRENQLCFLLGIEADGTVYPLDDVPCEVQLVLTQNGRDIGSAWINATVQNESGHIFRKPINAGSVFPCFIEVDSDGDGTFDLSRTTMRFSMTVSASGQLHLSCLFNE